MIFDLYWEVSCTTYIIIPDQLGCVCAQSFSRVHLFATPWTVARQASLSVEFSKQEYWSGLPFPTPGDLPEPGIESASLWTCQVTVSFSFPWSCKFNMFTSIATSVKNINHSAIFFVCFSLLTIWQAFILFQESVQLE